jgi:hypothetical protein
MKCPLLGHSLGVSLLLGQINILNHDYCNDIQEHIKIFYSRERILIILGAAWWIIPVISAIWKGETGRITF